MDFASMTCPFFIISWSARLGEAADAASARTASRRQIRLRVFMFSSFVFGFDPD
jgi:hypothetical protein